MAWGYHLVLDCYEGDKELITSSTNIAAFAKALVQRIQMKAYGEPQVIHFGEDDKQGYTLVQLIETSNITGHFCDDTGNFYLDVFSCKPYENAVVIETVKQFFAPKKIIDRYIERE
jgi:S-adenosylmethionine/arginine decarboxylase-like enzyme